MTRYSTKIDVLSNDAWQLQLSRFNPPSSVKLLPEWHTFDKRTKLFLVRTAVESSLEASAACLVCAMPSRILPGHYSLRIPQGALLGSEEAIISMLEYLCTVGGAEFPGMTLSLVIYEIDEFSPVRNKSALQQLGFKLAKYPQDYSYTQLISLTRDLDEIKKSFKYTARRQIKKTLDCGYHAHPITEPRYAEQLVGLADEAFRRSANQKSSYDPGRDLYFARRHPSLVKIVGLCKASATNAMPKIEAFAVGHKIGSSIVYSTAGSHRIQGNVPTGYLLCWELMKWGRSVGAEWFDFGGVSDPAANDSKYSGITNFKSQFSGKTWQARQEFEYDLLPVRARFARNLSYYINAASRLV